MGKNKYNFKQLRSMTLFSDLFMSAFFDNELECTQLLLQIILGKKELQLQSCITQRVLVNLHGHSVKFDIYAVDIENKNYNIEVQAKKKGSSPKRARYYSSMMDVKRVEAGENYAELGESYVVFITKSDYLNTHKAKSVYTRIDKQSGKPLYDGTSIVYVDGSVKDETPLGKLMQDFSEPDPDKMNYEVLARRMRFLKEQEEGVSYMCEVADEILNEGIELGKAEGIELGKAEGKVEGIELGKAEGKVEGIEIGKVVGKVEGIELGKAEGIEVGKVLSCKEVILENLEEIGAVSNEVKQTVEHQGDFETLKKWSRLSAKVKSVKEFMGKIACL